MFQYPKINDESILLHKECKRLLRRTSRKYIIEEVINKLNNKEIKENNKEIKENNELIKENNWYESFKKNKNITFLEVLLIIFTCNIYKYKKYD